MLNAFVSQPLRSDELLLYQSIGKQFFPDADWDRGLPRVSRLLARWPRGIQTVRQGTEIVGYMVLWPLSGQAAHQLETGQLIDDGLDADCQPGELGGRIAHWIMPAVAVVPSDVTARREIITLLLAFLSSVRAENAPVSIYAHAVTAAGHRFCTRTGFRFLFPAIPQLCVLRDPPG